MSVKIDQESLRTWLSERNMPKPVIDELIRCVEVTEYVDEEIEDWKRKH